MQCTICQDVMGEDGVHTLSECGHRFHTHCVVRWFRSNGSCPLCRGEPEIHMCRLDTIARYKMLRRKSRARAAPAALKTFVKRIQKVERTLAAKRKALRDLRGTSASALDGTVRDMLKEVSKARNAVFNTNLRLRRLKRALGLTDFETPGFRLPNVVSRVVSNSRILAVGGMPRRVFRSRSVRLN